MHILEIFIEKRSISKTIRFCTHLLFWLAIFLSAFFYISYSYSVYKNSPLRYLVPLRHTLGLVAVFYPLMYAILPAFMNKKRWVGLFWYSTLLLFVYIFIDAFGEQLTFRYCESCRDLAIQNDPNHLKVIQKSLMENILYKGSNIGLYVNLFSNLVLPIAVKIGLGYYQVYTRNLQLEKEKAELELHFLKSQVNPHFLFNTLNNLYSLILHERKEMSTKTVTRLSDYLRYSLENALKDKVSLKEEIQLLKDYINLESLRLNHTAVSIQTTIEDDSVAIPPLLFMPLIENAFKYTTDKKGDKILVIVKQKENTIAIETQNSFEQFKKTTTTGLGLKHLKKRLHLYYKDTYSYEVEIEDHRYTASLKLFLK